MFPQTPLTASTRGSRPAMMSSGVGGVISLATPVNVSQAKSPTPFATSLTMWPVEGGGTGGAVASPGLGAAAGSGRAVASGAGGASGVDGGGGESTEGGADPVDGFCRSAPNGSTYL